MCVPKTQTQQQQGLNELRSLFMTFVRPRLVLFNIYIGEREK